MTSPELSPTRSCSAMPSRSMDLAASCALGLDVERGQAGREGVVLQGYRGAEQRHQAVAGELVHGAADRCTTCASARPGRP